MQMDPITAGLIAATIHHFIVQYPNQASLIATFYLFSLINAVYLTVFLRPEDAALHQRIGRFIKDFFVFNSIYVRMYEDNPNSISVYQHFLSRPFTMYISDTLGFLRNFGMRLRIGHIGRISNLVNHT